VETLHFCHLEDGKTAMTTASCPWPTLTPMDATSSSMKTLNSDSILEEAVSHEKTLPLPMHALQMACCKEAS
jgi:hypothetical protein